MSEATITARPMHAGAALRAVLLALVALVLSACTTTGMFGGGEAPTASVQPQAQPVEDPVASEEHARIIAAYGGIYHDDKLEQTVARIVGRLVAASDDPGRSYRVTILNAPAVNAFALPDGYLYVTRGLLALANDSSEVAAVLAHEMAHVTANHAAQRQERARTAVIVSEAVTGALNDSTAGQLALTSGQRSLASFSRQQELEADAIGIRTAGKAGFDPFAASRFLADMSRFADYRAALGGTSDRRAEFLSTHPNNPERIQFAIRAARQFGAPPIGETERERYLAGIDGMVFGDDIAQGYVRGRNFLHPGLGVAFSVPDGFLIDNGKEAVLATGVDGTALRFDSVDIPAGTALPDYLASGWINGLTPGSIRAFTVGGLPAASASAAARGWVFRIAVVRVDAATTYRFIFANQEASPAFESAASSTVASFRRLSPAEIADLKPLRVRLVTVRPGDTPEAFAARMPDVPRPLDLFRALNGIDPGTGLAPGAQVKIVTE